MNISLNNHNVDAIKSYVNSIYKDCDVRACYNILDLANSKSKKKQNTILLRLNTRNLLKHVSEVL